MTRHRCRRAFPGPPLSKTSAFSCARPHGQGDLSPVNEKWKQRRRFPTDTFIRCCGRTRYTVHDTRYTMRAVGNDTGGYHDVCTVRTSGMTTACSKAGQHEDQRERRYESYKYRISGDSRDQQGMGWDGMGA
ncbi:hypothetical protein DENSPDRAFT_163248 [Dentipellis sp. KUC8613]|nr:hypothetical protein DENSPDRAFT_163248 [Dentipellis sp. KUC8613]